MYLTIWILELQNFFYFLYPILKASPSWVSNLGSGGSNLGSGVSNLGSGVSNLGSGGSNLGSGVSN